MKLVVDDEEAAGWVTPEFVAEVMLDTVVKDEYVGGSIVEVGSSVRVVSTFNDKGPAAYGNSCLPKDSEEDDMWTSLVKQAGGEKARGNRGPLYGIEETKLG